MSAHRVEADTDCMGRDVPAYWREFLDCSDGSVVMGVGQSADEAENEARIKHDNHEGWCNKDPRTRLRELISGGTRLTKEGDDALKAIAEILLGEKL